MREIGWALAVLLLVWGGVCFGELTAESLRADPLRYVLRATVEGRRLMDLVSQKANGRLIATLEDRKKAEALLLQDPDFAQTRIRLEKVAEYIQMESNGLYGNGGGELTPVVRLCARKIARDGLTFTAAEGKPVYSSRGPTDIATMAVSPDPPTRQQQQTFAELLDAFLGSGQGGEGVVRQAHSLLLLKGVSSTVKTDAFGGPYLEIDLTGGKGPLNEIAAELAQLWGKTRLRYSPDYLRGPSAVYASISRGGSEPNDILYLSHESIAYGEPDEAVRHELLHQLLQHLEQEGVSHLFSGTVERPNVRSSVPYAKFMVLEELATFSLSLHALAESIRRGGNDQKRAMERLSTRTLTAEAVAVQSVEAMEKAVAALSAADGSRVSVSFDFVFGKDNRIYAKGEFVQSPSTGNFTVQLPLMGEELVKQYWALNGVGDASERKRIEQGLRNRFLQELQSRLTIARDLSRHFKRIARLVASGAEPAKLIEALEIPYQAIAPGLKALLPSNADCRRLYRTLGLGAD